MNYTRSSFYKRRITKIFPVYFPVLIVWMILQITERIPENIGGFIIGNLTGLSLWTETFPHFNWYVQSLLLFYGIAPLLKNIIDTYEKKGTFICVVMSLFIMPVFWCNEALIAVSRLPIFIIGMYLGKCIIEQKKITLKSELLTYVFSAIGILIITLFLFIIPDSSNNYGIFWYPFILITLGLCIFLTRLFDFIKIFRNFFYFIGTSSFEIYLIHIVVFDYIPQSEITNITWLWIYIFMLISGVTYHFVFSLCVKRYKKKLFGPMLRKSIN